MDNKNDPQALNAELSELRTKHEALKQQTVRDLEHQQIRFRVREQVWKMRQSQDITSVLKAQEGKIAYRPDITRDDPYNERVWIEKVPGRIPTARERRAFLDVPFSHGTLFVTSFEPNAFSAADVEVLESFARLLSEGFQRMDDLRMLEKRRRTGARNRRATPDRKAVAASQRRSSTPAATTSCANPFARRNSLRKWTEHLGLSYIYEEEEQGAATQTELTREALAVLPAAWRRAAYEAAKVASEEHLEVLLAELGAEHGVLAATLAPLVRDFRFDEIMELMR